jgi:lysophospholipid acyltransferase (LPLAT)-like uncharacterized protein
VSASPPARVARSPLRRAWKSRRARSARLRVAELVLFPLLGALARLWFRALHARVAFERRGPLFELLERGEPCIVALWHQDVFPLMFELFLWTPARPTLFLVHHGFAGALGAHLLGLWGIECVAGSGARRGVPAVEELARRVRERPQSVFLMADGASGPPREARWGAVHLARDTGLPIVPARGWTDHQVTLRRTWMRLVRKHSPSPVGRRKAAASVRRRRYRLASSRGSVTAPGAARARSVAAVR